MSTLTHLDERGQARMVDVGEKSATAREAVARAEVVMRPETAALIRTGTAAKGDVLAAARIAGIMGAKRTSDLIPLCHPIAITGAEVRFEWAGADSAGDAGDAENAAVRLRIEASARTVGQTGVEMEALTAVTVAALTVYDMCKAVDRGMRIEDVRLVRKTGGKSGTYEAD
jgi:cyclic pyranopterin phosphate synthase